ncbi:putative Mg2+ transporter-C (MgtC) family protein [Flavobacterium sp. 28YEA47A]|uniref:MgtC/SapB family protein n=1 Tax=Flavobacterium sp. 28YEA47A TaxID=3156276 RepID=UPI00351202D6
MSVDIEIIIRFLLAILWGGIVGAEREYKGKAAGFRTTIMISFGACFFTIMSIAIGGDANPDRIASNIVTGLGFLCAGVIFKSDNHINGITTAATVWAVAAVGMGIGGGYYIASASGSLLILFILLILPYFQKIIDKRNQFRVLTIEYAQNSNALEICLNLMKKHNIRHQMMKQIREKENMTTVWEIHARQSNLMLFSNTIMAEPSIDRVETFR